MIFASTLLGAVVSQRQSVVEGLRTIALKLEFGVSHNQTFEKYFLFHFLSKFSPYLILRLFCYQN